MTKQAAFISLVGVSNSTDQLYRQLEQRLPRLIGKEHACVFLGNPFADYDNIRIDGKSKRDFVPAARVLFRWGLFWQFNSTVVKKTFEDGADIVVARRFGFNLYAGALAFSDCEKSLGIHHMLVPKGVMELGIPAPLYLFTESTDARTRLQQHQYFSAPGQSWKGIDPDVSVLQKLDQIVEIIRDNFKPRSDVAAA